MTHQDQFIFPTDATAVIVALSLLLYEEDEALSSRTAIEVPPASCGRRVRETVNCNHCISLPTNADALSRMFPRNIIFRSIRNQTQSAKASVRIDNPSFYEYPKQAEQAMLYARKSMERVNDDQLANLVRHSLRQPLNS